MSRTKTANKKSPKAKKAAPRPAKANATKKKTAPKSASKKTASKKKSTKKPATKKPATKKPAAKKNTTKKPTPKKPTPKKPAKKKAAPTKAPSKTSKKLTKTTAKKSASKKPAAKKATSKKADPKKQAAQKTTAKPAASKKTTKKAPAQAESKADAQSGKKTGRKGITIVSDRKKKSRTKAPRKPFVTPGGSLLGPGVVRKPLIPSGPSVTATERTKAADPNAPKKTPFNKRELTKFKNLLIIKRAELFGDIEQMEADALRSNSGNLSHLPQHLADQGSDSYEQSLSLNLAAADRRLIKEIDDALARIDSKTYGICELTAKPIRKTRLQELPWARYSIEAAREMERRGGF